jgi:lambda family phage portal protein
LNVLDKVIGAISPERALKRTRARMHLNVINQGYGSHGASVHKKSMAGWLPSSGSATEDIEQNIDTLRKRSRDLFMGAPISTGALRSTVTNVVGAGLKLNAQIDYEFLRMTPQEADEWETKVEREFAFWAESKNCDITRMSNFYELQQLALLSQLMSGDCFALLPMVKRLDSPYEICVQLIEADRVCNPYNLFSLDNKVVNGVEIDFKGEVVAYHLAKYHPYSAIAVQNKWVRVEKYGSKTGRPNILHLMEMERPEQRRGVPILAPVFESLKQLDRYSEAELMAAVISGMYTVFITSEGPPTDELGGIATDDELDPEDETTVEIGNGLVNYLNEGEKVETSNPGRPNTAFDGFVTSICRQIGAALEIPYEVLLKHFTSSYSASRGALLEAWKMYKRRRDWLANDFCQPIYEQFLVEAIAKGRIQAPGFFDDPLIRKSYCSAEWNGPTQGQLDPKKEVEAAILRVESGFSTRTRETTELTGGNFFANHTLRVMEEKARREAGFSAPVAINISSDAKEEEEGDETDE